MGGGGGCGTSQPVPQSEQKPAHYSDDVEEEEEEGQDQVLSDMEDKAKERDSPQKRRWGILRRSSKNQEELKSKPSSDKIQQRRDREHKDKEIVVADRFDALPIDAQRKVQKAGISPSDVEKHFAVLCNVLSFQMKVLFISTAQWEERQQKRKGKEERKERRRSRRIEESGMSREERHQRREERRRIKAERRSSGGAHEGNSSPKSESDTSQSPETSTAVSCRLSSNGRKDETPDPSSEPATESSSEPSSEPSVEPSARPSTEETPGHSPLTSSPADKGATNSMHDQESAEDTVLSSFSEEEKLPLLKNPHKLSNEELRLSTGDNAKKFFRNMELSGQGGFGRVYFAKLSKNGNKQKNDVVLPKQIAVKRMPHLTEKEMRNNISEITFLRMIDHPNVVTYYRSHLIKNEIWVEMEYLEGGTLTQAANGHEFTEGNIAYVARELLQGLAYLHSLNFVHRDLKSANIMMSVEGEIKLVDFGLCVDVSAGPRSGMAGSPFWMPPEMINREKHHFPADIWSFAISLLELANRHPPNRKSSLLAMFMSGAYGCPEPFDNPKKWSDLFKDFLSRCLAVDPGQRGTATSLLQHPFLQLADERDKMKNILRQVFVEKSLSSQGFF